MAKRTMTVEEHYSHGRSYPTIPRNTDEGEGANSSIKREPSMASGNAQGAWNRNTVQDAENKQDDRSSPRGYHNDVENDWRRGGGRQGAEGKPSFDKGQSYRRADKGNDWGSGHDPAIVRKPGPNTPNR